MKLSELPMPASSRTRAAVYVSFGTKNGPPLALAVRAVSVRVRVAAGFWADAAEAMKKRATHARSRRSNMKASKSGSNATETVQVGDQDLGGLVEGTVHAEGAE